LLFSDEIVAVANPKHPFAKQKVISAATLAGEPLILGEQGGNIRRRIDEFFTQMGVKPNVTMELSRQSAINRMVENNMGVGIAGVKAVSGEVADGKLVSWWIEGAQINWDLGLARLRGGYFSPIAQEFARLCRESFKEREREFKARK
jgi:DNA-binding transcriptional LysR family regulator